MFSNDITLTALARDVAARIGRIQDLMAQRDLGALLVVGQGSPDGTASVRYLTNARAWAGPLYSVMARDDPDPWVLSHSPYQAAWARSATTTRHDRVEAPLSLVERAAQLLRQLMDDRRRIGVAKLENMTLAERAAFDAQLSGYTFVDFSDDFDALRRIKSPLELAAFRQNGELLSTAMRVFAEHAKVGAHYSAACSAAEAFLKSEGAFWGRSKLAFGLSPITIPPPPDRRVAVGDAFTFELVYESPWGYWTEMTTHYAVGEFPDDMADLIDGYFAAFDQMRTLARPGTRQREISDAADAALAGRGWQLAGKHTPDCHSIGLDGSDGPSAFGDPDLELVENMVLSLHPGTMLEASRALLVSDNVLVAQGGGIRLSPHDAMRRVVRLPVARTRAATKARPPRV
jgi:Xaa-Pro aminopeptidase